MREFAKAFYHSQAWKRARAAYLGQRMSIDGGLCEMCQAQPGTEVHHKIFLRPENINDTNITLNPDNFMLLCFDCHQLEHEAARKTAALVARRRDRKKKVLQPGGYYLDDNGNLCPFTVRIIWGCPGSGKTTYARQHMQPGDVIIDLDLIGQALSLTTKTEISGNVELLAYDIRDYLYKRIADRTLDAKCAWVVASLPKKEQRQALQQKLNAELVFMPATFTECYRRALADPDRLDKALQLSIIEKWWKDYEPDQT